MLKACDLLERHPQLRPRDAVHAATMLNNGIESILTADSHFDNLAGITPVPIKA